MKNFARMSLAVLCALGIGVTIASAQTNGSFRTHSPLNNGNWSLPASWDRYNGSSWVNPAPNAPTGAETIYIAGTDSVNIDVPVTITGTINDSGRVNIGAGKLTIGNLGVYNCARDTGRIPTATWANGSTCLVTGAAKVAPSNANQNYYNFTWNCPNQTANLNVGWTGDTIRGNVACIASGSSSRFYFAATSGNTAFAAPITILGNVVVSGGTLSVNGSSSKGPVDPIVVNSYGNIKVTGGNFGCCRGSAPSVTWNIYGDTISISASTLQNSSSSATALQKFVFAKAGTQTLTISSDVVYGSATSPINMEVDSGTTLNIGSSIITSGNSGGFLVHGGGTVKWSGAGSIQATSTALATVGNAYVTTKHITGNGNLSFTAHEIPHPSSPNASKSIKRYWTIAASGTIAVDTLELFYLSTDVQGTEANYVPMRYTGTGTSWALGATGNSVNATSHYVSAIAPTVLSSDWTVGESSLTGVVRSTTNELPSTFYVNQNYPNPFNPSTNITYGLPKGSFVNATLYNILGQQVATLFVGQQAAGVHTISFNASSLSSGIYLYRIQAGNVVDVKRMVLIK